jgi:hypothetical protein
VLLAKKIKESIVSEISGIGRSVRVHAGFAANLFSNLRDGLDGENLIDSMYSRIVKVLAKYQGLLGQGDGPLARRRTGDADGLCRGARLAPPLARGVRARVRVTARRQQRLQEDLRGADQRHARAPVPNGRRRDVLAAAQRVVVGALPPRLPAPLALRLR